MAGLYKAELCLPAGATAELAESGPLPAQRNPTRAGLQTPDSLFGLVGPEAEEMQERSRFVQSRAAVALGFVLVVLTQQVCAGPLASRLQSGSDHSSDSVVHTLRRVARMTPLWRIMSSKPFGAYCQNNYECSTGLCRAGYCSTSHRAASEPVNY
ncbi:unnamed protein product [Pleuronectes platessa]|uniref:Liver-expressed antimicrobial peptide 2 n=1 Tax=Pleuronectes platessa TaxID=8262 RepID=A0A9N7UMA9_PLEPL|nr:unnamed protein product [Pleuronectes platessa]